ncbi:hypothetical protein UFOVP713_28 [uncultured Caudovirales phage]|uniref:Uncharacterized protein n=1 Tax=uncultured Caudovirales phage TaxID=2100421 RepID=A0A6J5NJF3_9CAUD|nr:hypothetical protein UFOVP713_28 [uncultured Caudovirales phage]
MSKIYFSRSISRTLSADHPVGDPTGGAAYGEKNDPVSAILSIAAMAGSYAPMMAGGIMAGVTFAGAAVSLVGNITGNKTLSKIGMVAGIVGGLGQMGAFGEAAKGATWSDVGIGSSTPPAGTSASTTSLKQSPVKDGSLADDMTARKADYANAQKVADSNVAAGVQTKGAAGMGNQPSNAAFNQGSRIAPTPAADVADDFAGGFKEIANPAGADQTGSGWRYFRDAGTGQSAAISPEGKYFLNGEQVTGAAGGKFGFGDYANMAWEGTKDIGAGFMNFAKENPYGALAVGQIAQPIADYLSGKTDAEIDALEAQTGYADANAQRMQEEIAKEKRRRENLNAGYAQVNTGITVNAPKQGLIAQQMPQA